MLIKRIIDARMGAEIYNQTVLKGHDPRDFVIFAAGGAGPVHCCGYAEAAGIGTVVVFPFSSVFCAYGSSTMDVLHAYERSRRLTLLSRDAGVWCSEYETFNEIVAALRSLARRDFAGEGLDADRVTYALELDIRFGGQLNVTRVASPLMSVGSQEDMLALYAAFEREFSEAYSPLGLHPEAGVEIEAFILRATLAQPVAARPLIAGDGSDVEVARTGGREAVFSVAGRVETPVYEMGLLVPGHRLPGPALIDSDDTTVVVAPGWSCAVDERSGMVLTLDRGETPGREAADV